MMKAFPGMQRPGPLGALVLGLLVAGCASSGGPASPWPGIDPAAAAPAGAPVAGAPTGVVGGTGGGAAPAPDPAWDHLDPADPPEGIRIYRADGTPATWDELVVASRAAPMLLLGEHHDDVRGHRLRHALVRTLAGGAAAGEPGGCRPLVLSLEMLETDVQLVVDEYLAGLITPDHFLRAARPWPNHARDYAPYLEVARACASPMVAANPPRRYVNRVGRLGEGALEALGPEARALLPPLPVAPPSDRYRAQWRALMGGSVPGASPHGAPPPHGAGHATGGDAGASTLDPMLAAQNLWDAGMAWAVAEAARRHPAAQVIHVAGAFHVQHGTGIPEHLAHYLPGVTPLVVVTLAVSPGTTFDLERHGGAGDFVLLSDRVVP